MVVGSNYPDSSSSLSPFLLSSCSVGGYIITTLISIEDDEVVDGFLFIM